MQKVLILTPSCGSQIYDILSGQTAESIAAGSGVTDPSLYQEFAESDFEAACYLYPGAFTLVGGVVGFELPTAKVQASSHEKAKFATLEAAATDGYGPNALSSQASLPESDRLPEIQAVIDSVNTLTVELSANLAAIASATSATEVSNIAYPPTGTLFTGRGSGLGPDDLNVSYYNAFNSASLTEAETELYIPSTNTVIAYGSGGPGQFDSTGNCFNLGGPYTMQIREAATSRVIAEFEVPLNTSGEDVAF